MAQVRLPRRPQFKERPPLASEPAMSGDSSGRFSLVQIGLVRASHPTASTRLIYSVRGCGDVLTDSASCPSGFVCGYGIDNRVVLSEHLGGSARCGER